MEKLTTTLDDIPDDFDYFVTVVKFQSSRSRINYSELPLGIIDNAENFKYVHAPTVYMFMFAVSRVSESIASEFRSTLLVPK